MIRFLYRHAWHLTLAIGPFSLGVLSRPALKTIKSELINRWAEASPGQLSPDNSPSDPQHYARKSSQYEQLGEARKIVFLGDSRVEDAEWSELLSSHDISNRGISGDTTTGVLLRLRTSIPRDISLCILQLGVNDLSKGCSVDFVLSKYDQILTDLLERVNARVLVSAVILAGDDRASLNPVISEFNRQLALLVARRGAVWIDVNQSLCPNGILPAAYTNDGIHLNGEGYRKFSTLLSHHLEK